MTARTGRASRMVLTSIVVAGLAVDAFVHFHLAASYAGVRSASLSQADLFRVEGALAVIAAVALLVRPRRWTAGLAFLVSAGGVAAVLLYRYVDVGALGPLPNMYEPLWYPEKTLSLWAEAAAALASLALLAVLHFEARRAIDTAPRPALPLAADGTGDTSHDGGSEGEDADRRLT